MIDDHNDGQMIFGELGGLKLPDICPKKTSPRKLVPAGDRTRARCVTGAHATAVDVFISHNSNFDLLGMYRSTI